MDLCTSHTSSFLWVMGRCAIFSAFGIAFTVVIHCDGQAAAHGTGCTHLPVWPGMHTADETETVHYVHSASLAYEDGSVFMSGPFAKWL